jgi:hypothetical protein
VVVAANEAHKRSFTPLMAVYAIVWGRENSNRSQSRKLWPCSLLAEDDLGPPA